MGRFQEFTDGRFRLEVFGAFNFYAFLLGKIFDLYEIDLGYFATIAAHIEKAVSNQRLLVADFGQHHVAACSGEKQLDHRVVILAAIFRLAIFDQLIVFGLSEKFHCSFLSVRVHDCRGWPTEGQVSKQMKFGLLELRAAQGANFI